MSARGLGVELEWAEFAAHEHGCALVRRVVQCVHSDFPAQLKGIAQRALCDEVIYRVRGVSRYHIIIKSTDGPILKASNFTRLKWHDDLYGTLQALQQGLIDLEAQLRHAGYGTITLRLRAIDLLSVSGDRWAKKQPWREARP